MKNLSVIKVIILSLITLGIYTLFWLRDTRKELVDRGQNVPPVKVILAPVLVLFVVILLQFVAHTALQNNVANKGLNFLSVLIGPIVVIAILPLTVWWYYKYCKAIEVVTQGQTSLTVSLGLLVVLSIFGFSFVWPGIIQDGFNRLSATPAPGFMPPAAPGI